MRKILSLFIFVFSFAILSGQEEKEPIELAPFVISADNSLDVEDFMQKVLIDSSFYQAFINLKYIPHDLRSTLFVRNKGEKQKGKLDRTATQRLENEHRVVEILSEESNGRIYKKNGYHRYLTAEMYDEVFFPSEPGAFPPRFHRTRPLLFLQWSRHPWGIHRYTHPIHHRICPPRLLPCRQRS